MPGMSNAERQKKYRERKKAKEGENYLKREVQRVQKYYIPTSELSSRALSKRRKKIKESMRQHRQRTKVEQYTQATVVMQNPIEDNLQSNDDTIGPCDSTTSPTGQQLFVKMNFNQDNHGTKRKRRKNKSLSRANKKVKTLEVKLKTLGTRNATLRKRVQRLKEKVDKASIQQNDINTSQTTPPSTPNRSTREEVNCLNMTPKSRKKVQKQLLFKNCFFADLENTIKTLKGTSKQRAIVRAVCGKLVNKYRMGRSVSRTLGVHRKQLLKARLGKSMKKQRLHSEREKMRSNVVAFMERDDNSTCLPGKKDAHKDGKESQQKRILNDYIYNLHRKFLAENSSSKISVTVFGRMRPKHISIVKFSNRKTCLCQRHQNMVLKLKALKNLGMATSENPDSYVEHKSDFDIIDEIQQIDEQKVRYAEWKRVDVEKKGKTFKRMQIVSSEKGKEEFIALLRTELQDFRRHIDRVKVQYGQSRRLKETLPKNHAICHMDFAENYTCGFADEIQSAYFDKNTVTLHPVVIYTKDNSEGAQVKHRSLVVVSDELSHTASTVFSIMKNVITEVKVILPDVKMVHYMTDSPTSQYRNKQMFSVVAQHDTIFPGIKASWLYFEAGHGKGPCDGVGGTAKRLADMAVKRHSAIIQSADDFYQWGKTQENSSLKYIFVPRSQCTESHKELSTIVGKPLKGTLQVHAVIPVEEGKIAVRDTSCYCDACFVNGVAVPACEGWTIHQMVVTSDKDSVDDQDKLSDHSTEETLITSEQDQIIVERVSDEHETKTSEVYEKDEYVGAVYESKWYIGQIVEYDADDQEYYINFMESGRKSFKWPKNMDIIWIPSTDVLCTLNKPVQQGKTRNVYKFNEKDIEKVQSLFEDI